MIAIEVLFYLSSVPVPKWVRLDTQISSAVLARIPLMPLYQDTKLTHFQLRGARSNNSCNQISKHYLSTGIENSLTRSGYTAAFVVAKDPYRIPPERTERDMKSRDESKFLTR